MKQTKNEWSDDRKINYISLKFNDYVLYCPRYSNFDKVITCCSHVHFRIVYCPSWTMCKLIYIYISIHHEEVVQAVIKIFIKYLVFVWITYVFRLYASCSSKMNFEMDSSVFYLFLFWEFIPNVRSVLRFSFSSYFQ